ncbi:beta-N-acetylhexosaminidase [Paenibacillus sp. 1001270B_150601_E10]|uniref:beta-N-acetylhexosaminidase n=1 Tax=Paenibacillus sp. 1001270B_150601_E10 TaxID=2787079 RepID=UPI00189ED1A2|nr:beta-N-acetylhexosaminidase [Paenibacillus sp. 1001270B_150601_E10]
MKLRFDGDIQLLEQGIRELAQEIPFERSDDGIPVVVEASPIGDLEVGFNGQEAYIRYAQKHQFFRGLGLLVQRGQGGEAFQHQETQRFDSVGPMFDLSRNGVLTVDSFKLMLRKMALMGMNTVMLYMEDTYEIEGEPYFGYMRGRYTQEEIRSIDDYADQFGIEAFPSIQTLAHLEEFLKWEPVKEYKDTKGALLANDERVLDLVERMIEASSAPFRSRKMHIGMDEAEEVGRGKYLDKNGYAERFDIMVSHLDKVLEIVRRKGLEPIMWSDMFLKLASKSSENEHFSHDTEIPEEMASRIPKDVEMVYWDYAHIGEEHYEQLIENHRPLGTKLSFAGGVWVFNTFGVNYGLSLLATADALKVCKREGIRDVYATMWGDDGMESNPYIALLGLQFYAEHAYTEADVDQAWLEERVKFCTGIDYDTFLLVKDLDETPGSEPNNRKQSNPSKFLLYQDVLLGLFDKQIEGLPMNDHYAALEASIQAKRNSEAALDYIFDVPEKLSRVLKLKSEIGIDLKRAYDAKDHETMRSIALDTLPKIISAVKALRASHRSQWLSMFKPFGWEVIDIRYGGVVHRLESAADRIMDYVEGRIERIEELEQERLVFSTRNRFNHQGIGWSSYYLRMASPNVFFHVMNPF